MTTTQPLPRKRGLVVAIIGLGIPVLAHITAAGSASIPPVALLPLALVATLCVTASSKTWTVGRLIVALTGVGVVTHAALWAGHQSHLHSASSAATTHHADLLGSADVLTSAAAHPLAASPHGLTPSMILAHIAAVALSVTLLRNGETLLLWLSSIAERIWVPEVRLPAIPRATYPAALHQTPALSSYIGVCGQQRAPPLLASI